jgi:hypothetical protein
MSRNTIIILIYHRHKFEILSVQSSLHSRNGLVFPLYPIRCYNLSWLPSLNKDGYFRITPPDKIIRVSVYDLGLTLIRRVRKMTLFDCTYIDAL